MLHGWIPPFNPHNPRGLVVLVWATLRFLELEFATIARQTALVIGPMIHDDPNNPKREDLSFLVALDIDSGWVASVEIEGVRGKNVQILVDYEEQAIRCSRCLVMAHVDSDCPAAKPTASIPQEVKTYPALQQPLVVVSADQQKQENGKRGHPFGRGPELPKQRKQEIKEVPIVDIVIQSEASDSLSSNADAEGFITMANKKKKKLEQWSKRNKTRCGGKKV